MLRCRYVLHLLLAIFISVVITGCELGQVRLSEEDVWRAFTQAPIASNARSNADGMQVLPRSEYTIMFIGRNGTIVGSTANSAKCFPHILKATDESLEGVQYVYEVRTRVDDAIQAKVEFTRWEGIDNWWVWVSGSCFEYKQ